MIILASQSPYRKILLEKTAFHFKTDSPLADEEALKKDYKKGAKELIKFLAFKKAESLLDKYKEHIIIGSDQALVLGEKLIGKGHNFEGAKKQLKLLSGQEVELITSVCLLMETRKVEFSNITKLQFRILSDEVIDWYLNKDKPFDCAGSFKMEASGALLFERVENSDPTAIQGLPLMRLSQELEKLLAE